MAEEEKIVHHAKEAVHALTNKEKKWKEKVKDFLLEILIIIIAVSITLWFHNWNDRKHEREQEKEFLIGIREDLEGTKDNINKAILNYQPASNYYDSLWNQIKRNKINNNYIDSNSNYLLWAAYFVFDNSRFESFKSSGYLSYIENKDLLKDITKLYSALLPNQKYEDDLMYNEKRQQFITYIGSKAYIDTSGRSHISGLINEPSVRFQIVWQKNSTHVNIVHKKQLIGSIDSVIHKISLELKDRFDYDVSDKK